MVVSAGETAAPERLITNEVSFTFAATSGMTHPAWLHPSIPICDGDVFAGFKELDRGDGIARKVVEGFGSPVSGGLADSTLVVSKHGHAVADQKVRKGKKVLSVFRAGCRHQHDRRVLTPARGRDKRTAQMDVVVREDHVFVDLILNPTRNPRR